jgi:hypothetical protein
MHSREEIEQWISRTRRTQRRLNVIMAPAAVASIALLVWNRAVGGFALLCVALVAICGYWITSSHLADWERELEERKRPAPQKRAGRYERD